MRIAVLAGRSGLAASDSASDPTEAAASAAEEFARFYEQAKGALRAYLMASTRDGGLADDLTQEAFLRLYTAQRTFSDGEHRRRYLFRIASNLLVDHWRTARRATLSLDERALDVSAQAAFTDRPPDLDNRQDLVRAFGKLQPRERQLIWLAHVEQLDHREIAAVVAVSEASVRVLLFRARRRLAAALQGDDRRSGTKGVAK